MDALFSENEAKSLGKIKHNFADEGPKCLQCGLYQNCKHPKMRYTGEGRTGVLIIAEAQGKTEDEYNKQLIGEIGQDFRNDLNQYDLDLDRDFWKVNACACWPNRNGKTFSPDTQHINSCRPLVWATIEELQPKGWRFSPVRVGHLYRFA